jgi:2-aminoadipate transaminase
MRFAPRAARITGSVIDSTISVLQRAPRDTISFAMGSVAPDALPANVLREAATNELGDPAALNYGPTEGEHGLRAALTDFLAARGTQVGDRELLITAGGMQGLDLVAKLFVGAGEVVIVEAPTYTNATATFAGYEGDLVEVPVDAGGLRIDELRETVERLGRPPRLVHVIPNFQNPTGVTLVPDRREALLRLGEEWGAVVLEDDPYGWLAFDAREQPSLYDLDAGAGRVIAVRTFSKVLAPGLRVGWIQAPPPVIERMIAAKQGMDTCTNVLGQRLVAAFLEHGLMEAHLDRLRAEYRANKETMIEALQSSFGDVRDATWTDPDGGFFLWLTLPGTAAETLAAVALEEGVAVIPGSAFSVAGAFGDALRLCFSYPARGQIPEGVRRLRRAYDRCAVEQAA